jgi:phytoene desaturase
MHVSGKKKKIIVIGSGVGGLGAAIRLASNGFDVEIFEKNSYAGGKIGEMQFDGYRFDTGPSVFTMPDLVEDLLMNEETAKFSYNQLEASCKYFYEDGTELIAYSDIEEFIKEIENKTNEKPDNIRAFLQKSKTIYDVTADVFLFNSIHDKKNLIRSSSLKALLNFGKIDAFSTMHESNAKRFNDDRIIQLFDRYATYNGSNPYQVPATLNIIPHLEHNLGTYFPEGGIYKIIKALKNKAEKEGVDFHFNTKVDEVVTLKQKVIGVRTGGTLHEADYVISNTDINYFYKHLLKDHKLLTKTLKPEKSSSALIFYWGVRGNFPQLKLHNILFSADYPAEFDHLFTKKTIFEDPTVYIFISSKVISSDAPEGKENWYVMINAPESTGQDWDQLRKKAREYITRKIKRMLGIDIEKHIEAEQVNDPVSIETQTSSYHGSLYGNSSNSKFAAFNRHPNYSKKYEGLYFTGGSVHPGGGIPLALSSAKIVSDYILTKHKLKI